MKKFFLTLLVLVTFIGSIFASDIVFDGVTTEGKEVYKFYPNGYALTAYLVIPRDVTMEHMLLVPYKDGNTDPSYGLKDSKVKLLCYQDSDYYGSGNVILFPVIPEFRDNFRHMELDRETLLSHDEFAHLDQQIVSLIDDALEFLEDEKDICLSDRVDIAGYSGEANFALRFSILHPDRVWAVCAGGSSWSPSMGSGKLMGKKLKYPLGVYDIDKYSDDFDLEAWKEIRFFVDMGLKDDRGSYNAPLFGEVNWAWGNEFPEIWENFQKAFVSLTDNAEMVSFYNLGHEPSKGVYNEFLRLNDDEDSAFTVVEPCDAAHILTSRYDYDVEESYNFLFYSPSVFHCSMCDSNVFTNDKNCFSYVCSNGHRNDVHMDMFVAGVYETEKPFRNYGKLTLLYPRDHYDGRSKRLILGDGSEVRMYSHGLGDGCLWIGFENFEIYIRNMGPDWIECDILNDGVTYRRVRFNRLSE